MVQPTLYPSALRLANLLTGWQRGVDMKERDTDLFYPSHKHPHGIANLPEWEARIWVCTECRHIFTDTELRKDELGEDNKGGWGHACKSHPCRKGQRCESHLEPYHPALNHLSGRV